MEIQHGDERFWTVFVQDAVKGFSGLDLYRDRNGHKSLACKLLYWDSAGQFSVQTAGEDVPLTVLMAAIEAVKEAVPRV